MTDITILVIDDSETNQVLLEAVLEDEGYLVKTAFSCADGERIMKMSHPDLILLDLLIPDVSGLEFLEKIKKSEEYRSIPVIIVTAFANKDNIHSALALGANGVIEKPIDIPEFLSAIKNAFVKL